MPSNDIHELLRNAEPCSQPVTERTTVTSIQARSWPSMSQIRSKASILRGN
jgi:hypothetical protein